jgi:hypothetical protein
MPEIVGDNSCNGGGACRYESGPVGKGSCNGEVACCDSYAEVGDGSCNGEGACAVIIFDENIGDRSCNGEEACKVIKVNVGNDSCNGNDACHCENPKGHRHVYDVGHGECNRKGADNTGGPTCCFGLVYPLDCVEETPSGALKVGNNTCVSINRGFTGGTLGCIPETAQFDTSECTKEPGCGDGIVQGGEECDGTNLASKTCATQGFTGGGTLKCNSACQFDTSECKGPLVICGNGVVEGTEQCDGTDLSLKTCATQGFPGGGTLKCNSACKFDTSQCKDIVITDTCGNGIVDDAEQCDGTNLSSKTCATQGFGGGTLKCNTTTCQFDTSECKGQPPVTCGDGVVEGTEQCDGTNLSSKTCATQGFNGGTLKCNATCQFDTSECDHCVGFWCFFFYIWLAFTSIFQGFFCLFGLC